MIPVKIIRKTKQGKGESKGVSSSGAYRPVGELLTLQEQVAGLTNTLALLHTAFVADHQHTGHSRDL